jgi:hypothetical protein
MTEDDRRDSVAPNNRDRARALRPVLAMLSDDFDLVRHIIAEPQTAGDVTHLILALTDEFAMSLKRSTDSDPSRFMEDRIRHFLGEAEKHGQ